MFSSLVLTLKSSFDFMKMLRYFIGGGWVNDWEGKNYLVLKFDIEKEEYYEYGRMIYGRKFHAISLVTLSDYSDWCTTYA